MRKVNFISVLFWKSPGHRAQSTSVVILSLIFLDISLKINETKSSVIGSNGKTFLFYTAHNLYENQGARQFFKMFPFIEFIRETLANKII